MLQYLKEKVYRLDLLLFFLLIALAAFANGFGDSIFANYFKEVYQVDAFQRGLIEFPRELPGLLCAVVIAFLSVLGDIRAALIAQVLSLVGLLVLGLFTPTFGVMLVFLFISSMGNHLFLPLQDSIGMDLAEPDQVGFRMGQYASVRSVFSFLSGILVFVGFRFGFFTFDTPIKWVFVLGSIAFVFAILVSYALLRVTPPLSKEKKTIRFVFRKEYKYYYSLCILHGVQKQIAFVYGSWVLIDLLHKGADMMALLLLIASFICIFFMRFLGNCIDRFGVRNMLFVDALTFIGVYVIYGFVVLSITTEFFTNQNIAAALVYLLFVLDRLSMQIGMVKSVYLRAIAFSPEDVTATLSTGTSLDHVVSIAAAIVSGWVWVTLGSHWVFFIAAAFSLGNLYVAYRIKEPENV